ncbi:hypothetical protein UYO_2239 [Lachnospiraceae bacterium JC7]|nr:hypothetical protein UYO_2239 [Lachnospiraceae bacterium JC7]
MADYNIGDLVAYEKETKEWKIIKIELSEGKHSDNIVYTLKKVRGQDLGRKVTIDKDDLL